MLNPFNIDDNILSPSEQSCPLNPPVSLEDARARQRVKPLAEVRRFQGGAEIQQLLRPHLGGVRLGHEPPRQLNLSTLPNLRHS
jgi:hypothetical protein